MTDVFKLTPQESVERDAKRREALFGNSSIKSAEPRYANALLPAANLGEVTESNGATIEEVLKIDNVDSRNLFQIGGTIFTSEPPKETPVVALSAQNVTNIR